MAHLGLSNQRVNLISHDYGDTVALELLYRYYFVQDVKTRVNNSVLTMNILLFPEPEGIKIAQDT